MLRMHLNDEMSLPEASSRGFEGMCQFHRLPTTPSPNSWPAVANLDIFQQLGIKAGTVDQHIAARPHKEVGGSAERRLTGVATVMHMARAVDCFGEAAGSCLQLPRLPISAVDRVPARCLTDSGLPIFPCN